jgi:hypothetical protein
MIYGEDAIKQIILTNPNKAMLDAARVKSKKLRMHIEGEGLDEYIEGMPYFEKAELLKIRKKYARSNRDLFDRLFRQRDKVFSAKGGSKKYMLPETQEKQLKAYLHGVKDGMSLEKWIEVVALKSWDVDPMSLTFIELNQEGKAYPTYKSTSVIYDYELKGRRPKYVLFSLTQGEIAKLVQAQVITTPATGSRVYRFVDDVSDRIVVREGEVIFFPKSAQFPNYFMTVPGMVNSDMPVFNSDMYQSSADVVMELAQEFLNDGSAKVISKKYHMFLKAWELATECGKCKGTRFIGDTQCPECNGEGIKPYTKPSDIIKVSPSDENTKIPIPPGGYFTPPKEGWEMMNLELQLLESAMRDTYWGTGDLRRAHGPDSPAGGETATEILDDYRPIADRLKVFTDWAQHLNKFCADLIGAVMFASSYKGSSIVYGDRYMLENPDQLWKKYNEARKSGAPDTALDSFLIEYYEGKYSGNPMQLQRHLILMKVEPFIHVTVDTILKWPVSDQMKLTKVYFGEWNSSLTDMEVIGSTPEALRKALDQYVISVQPAIEKPKEEPIPA